MLETPLIFQSHTSFSLHYVFESEIYEIQATPSEFLLETPRPISNQIKYFGSRRFRPEINNKRSAMDQSIRNLTGLNVDWDTSNGVIVVSFGSIITGERMPDAKRNALLQVFAGLNQTVIWHYAKTKSPRPETPPNVFLSDWLPLKQLLRMSSCFFVFFCV